MAETDLISQLTPHGVPAVSFGDVVELTRPAPKKQGEESFIQHLAEEYGGLGFLPNYLARKNHELVKLRTDNTITPVEYVNLKARLDGSSADGEERHINEVRTARRLMRLALRLYDLLQNDAKITCSTLAELGIVARSTPRWSDAKEDFELERGTIECDWSVTLPPSDYLEYVQESVDWLSSDAWRADCVIEAVDGEGKLPHIGWVGTESSVRLSYVMHDVPDSARGYRLAAVTLLSFVQDLHSCHVRVLNYGVGRVRMFSTDVVTQLWVTLRESASGGRIGFCRVCGKPFVATGERGFKHLYCGNSCKQAFNRAKRVLALVEAGRPPEEAKDEVRGISLNRVKDIATRNGLFKDGIDYGL